MKISRELAIKIDTLKKAGFGYNKISNELNLKKSTVAKHCQKSDHLSRLPPKEKVYKGKIQGRNQLKIKKNY